MKNITCFIESLAGGGAEHQMVILCKTLQENGYHVTLATYADVPDHYLCPNGVERIKIGVGKGPFAKLWKTIVFFLRIKTDVLISYRVACNVRALTPLIFRPQIKVIAGERNFTIGKRSFLGKLCDNLLYYRANHIVANSYSQEKYLRSLNKRWAKRVCTIINYTDLIQFDKSEMPQNQDVVNIGIFARFSPQKNAPLFIKMLKELTSSTNTPFHIDWYGSKGKTGGDSGFISAQRLINDLSLSDVIELKEPVKNPANLMNLYHAICLPSLYEGFSNSIAEGICSGKPMLVSDVSDNSVMVHEGVNGFLFDPTSIENMKTAFLKFFNTSMEQKISMGVKSREIAETLFDSDSYYHKHQQLIES